MTTALGYAVPVRIPTATAVVSAATAPNCGCFSINDADRRTERRYLGARSASEYAFRKYRSGSPVGVWSKSIGVQYEKVDVRAMTDPQTQSTRVGVAAGVGGPTNDGSRWFPRRGRVAGEPWCGGRGRGAVW